MKKIQVCGLGNAIVDILVRISEQEFETLGYEKGTMNLIHAEAQELLIKRFQGAEPVLASGGSVANSIVTFAELGGRAAFTGCVGDDRYGLFYSSEFDNFGITLTHPPIINEVTGTCLSLITPDSERTMRTCLGVSGLLGAEHIDSDIISNSEWIFIEGYLFSNPDNGQKAIFKAIDQAAASKTKIAITFSDTWVIENFRPALDKAVEKASLIFANEHEAMTYTGEKSKAAAFKALSSMVPHVAMTAGADGAYLFFAEEEHHIPAYSANPVDMTGAGDAFAGAYLYGITNNVPPLQSAQAGCFLASKVISQIGARLRTGVRDYWGQITGVN